MITSWCQVLMNPTVQSYRSPASRKARSECFAKFQVRCIRVQPGASTRIVRTASGNAPAFQELAKTSTSCPAWIRRWQRLTT